MGNSGLELGLKSGGKVEKTEEVEMQPLRKKIPVGGEIMHAVSLDGAVIRGWRYDGNCIFVEIALPSVKDEFFEFVKSARLVGREFVLKFKPVSTPGAPCGEVDAVITNRKTIFGDGDVIECRLDLSDSNRDRLLRYLKSKNRVKECLNIKGGAVIRNIRVWVGACLLVTVSCIGAPKFDQWLHQKETCNSLADGRGLNPDAYLLGNTPDDIRGAFADGESTLDGYIRLCRVKFGVEVDPEKGGQTLKSPPGR